MHKRKLTVIEQMRAEIHGKLCDQRTGEATGLNQYFDSLAPKPVECRFCAWFHVELFGDDSRRTQCLNAHGLKHACDSDSCCYGRYRTPDHE